MGYWIFMLSVLLVMPLTMLLMGHAFQKRAPSHINPIFGYRTAMSTKNQATWTFAHRHFGRTWYLGGLVLTPLTVVVMLCTLGRGSAVVSTVGSILCALQLVFVLTAVIPTERALRRTFDKNGTRIT